MKKYFYFGLTLLLLFEFFRVYLIMPMPGSQESNTINLAYHLHQYRWMIRIILAGMLLTGIKQAFTTKGKVLNIIYIIIAGIAIYLFNFPMSADRMFLQPGKITYAGMDAVKNDELQVIGITINKVSRAYPVSYLIYHHQVRDIISATPVMITYCSVCRTGRVYEPVVEGKTETFRLVGMDHYNAMFEDEHTGSWWRQATGEAIAGKRKGMRLKEIPSEQMTLAMWKKLHPDGKVFLPDENFISAYDSELAFENGTSTSSLTGTNHNSWENKSWVAGVIINDQAKAYDWNQLKKERVINDRLNNKHLAIILFRDDKSFAAFIKEDSLPVSISGDTLFYKNHIYKADGRSFDGLHQLQQQTVYQEFWHSWKTFHPETVQYK